MKVWLSTLRRGIAWHTIQQDGRKTVCGRYIGPSTDNPAHGHVLPIVRAVDDYAAAQCSICAGRANTVEPTVVRSRRG